MEIVISSSGEKEMEMSKLYTQQYLEKILRQYYKSYKTNTIVNQCFNFENYAAASLVSID